jgi:dipeptidyl aminopeptidase/acylaminoacyl peptidase
MALDVDEEGRLLVLYDGTGTRQINEVTPDGSWRALTALDDTVRTARFVPGSSRVVVEHDFGGSERGQLSLLDLGDQSAPPALVALVHDRAFKHNLVDAKPDRLLYTTNRRNGTDFDLVARELSTGVERVVYEGGGWVMGVKPSPDGKWVVLSLASAPANSMQLLLVDTTSRAVTELTPYDAHNDQQAVSWLPDSSGFVVSSDAGRDRLAVRRYDLDAAAWSDLLVDDERDLAGWVCPDGEHLLLAVTDDGVVSLELHKLADGALVTPLDLPAGGTAARAMMTPDPLWSPDGSFAVLTYGSPVEPPTVYRYTLASGEVVAMRPPGMPELPAELARPESHRVPSFDGEQVPVFVYRPTGPDLGSTMRLCATGTQWSQHSQPRATPSSCRTFAARRRTGSAGTRWTTGSCGWTRSRTWPRSTPGYRRSASTPLVLRCGAVRTAATWCWPVSRSSRHCGQPVSTLSGSPRW